MNTSIDRRGWCLVPNTLPDSTIDLQEVVDLLMAAYAWIYRLAAWDNADAPAMTAVMDRQIALIAAGFQPRD